MKKIIAPTDSEVFFREDEIIVSKTDLKGRITYANQTFCHVAGYTEAELLGEPHSIVRNGRNSDSIGATGGRRRTPGTMRKPMCETEVNRHDPYR